MRFCVIDMRILAIIFLLFCSVAFAQSDDEGGLRVTGLVAVDASAIGTLRPFNGGFSADFWQGLTAEEAIAAIQDLPSRYSKAELFLLARSILLTASPLSHDRADDSESRLQASDTSRAFILARLQKLYDMGLYQDAWELLQLVPGEYYNDSFERLSVDLQLQLGDSVNVCAALPNVNDLPQSEDKFWQKLLFLCEILDNRPDDAEFILNVLNEVNAFSDSFVLLSQQALKLLPADDLSTGDNDIISQILKEIAQPLTFNLDTNYSIYELHRLLQSPEVSNEDKSLIGLRLYRQGVITDKALSEIYDKLPYRSNRAKATRLTEGDYPHAYKALSGDKESNNSKAKIIRSLVLAADGGGYLPQTLRQLSPYLNLEPSESLKSYAKFLSVAELFKGDITKGTAWDRISKGKNASKANIYDLLLLLSEADLLSTYPVKLTDIYTQEDIKIINTPALLLADDIMRERREDLIGTETWQTLQADKDTSLAINRKLLLQARLIESQLETGLTAPLLDFIRHGNAIANEDPESYVRIWRLISLPILSRQAIIGYFLQNGFILGDD